MTKTILHIDASSRTADSVSRDLTAKIVAQLNGTEVVRRDVSAGLPLLSEAWVGANFTPAEARTEEQKQLLAQSDALVDELLAADVLVIGAPVYNFSVPAGLKTWIDHIARAGRTFQYTETGPVGLLEGKRAIIAVASGGTQVGSEIDFASTYLRHVLGFIGITDVEVIAADALSMDAEGAITRATEASSSLAA
jgi:FMN-dependent NADH-azoreductase